jgi:hypothetical protein
MCKTFGGFWFKYYSVFFMVGYTSIGSDEARKAAALKVL